MNLCRPFFYSGQWTVSSEQFAGLGLRLPTLLPVKRRKDGAPSWVRYPARGITPEAANQRVDETTKQVPPEGSNHAPQHECDACLRVTGEDDAEGNERKRKIRDQKYGERQSGGATHQRLTGSCEQSPHGDKQERVDSRSDVFGLRGSTHWHYQRFQILRKDNIQTERTLLSRRLRFVVSHPCARKTRKDGAPSWVGHPAIRISRNALLQTPLWKARGLKAVSLCTSEEKSTKEMPPEGCQCSKLTVDAS